MTKQNSKVDDFVDNLPAKYVYGRVSRYNEDEFYELVKESGLPKEEFISNYKFQEFVLARMATRSLGDTSISSERDSVQIIRPMIAESNSFAYEYCNLLYRVGATWNKRTRGDIFPVRLILQHCQVMFKLVKEVLTCLMSIPIVLM